MLWTYVARESFPPKCQILLLHGHSSRFVLPHHLYHPQFTSIIPV